MSDEATSKGVGGMGLEMYGRQVWQHDMMGKNAILLCHHDPRASFPRVVSGYAFDSVPYPATERLKLMNERCLH